MPFREVTRGRDSTKAVQGNRHNLVWQVLEDLGVQGRVLDTIKSMYAHDSAAHQKDSLRSSDVFWASSKLKAVENCWQ